MPASLVSLVICGRMLSFIVVPAICLTADDDLKTQLLSTYRLPTTHPVAAAAQLGLGSTKTCTAAHTEVSLQIYVDHFEVPDEQAQTYGFKGYLRAYWTDPRLVYSAVSGCSDDLLLSRGEALQIWRPDLYFDQVSTLRSAMHHVMHRVMRGSMHDATNPNGTQRAILTDGKPRAAR